MKCVRCLLPMLLSGFLSSAAQAATPVPPSAAESDPAQLGWMLGSPPPADKTIRFGDGSFYQFPQLRWSFSHTAQLVPTAQVSRGTAAVAMLPRAERQDIDAIAFTTLDGKSMTWQQSLAANYTDGIVVLHRGKIVYERYFGVFDASKQHSAFSVTKSFVGTLAAMLAAEGKLDPEAAVTKYLPELTGSAYGDATVRQLMDMTVGVKYSEKYTDPKAEVWGYARAGGMMPRPAGYQGPATFYEFLVTLQKQGEHGEGFAYKTVNTEVLAWVLTRISGQSLAQILSERIWSKLGAENDALLQVDSIGTASGGGGLNASLRDMARFGEVMRLDGHFNGQQIVPVAVVEDIRRGGMLADVEAAGYATLPGWSYRNMWWVSHNEHGAFSARGIHGQLIWVDPSAEMVIARFASNWQASNRHFDGTSLPAYMAVAKHLMVTP
jgi:CubicO group peptidase (beta-lactamase class C family)